jgi:2-oxoglutarate ferredoxin oxidoreductase subunit alpha
MKDAEIAIIAFGTAGRVASSAIKTARQEGIKVGLFRPITLAPFPSKQLEEISKRVKSILVVEMNTGQMLDDVNLAVNGRVPVEFYGRLGGVTPFPDEILEEIHRINENPPTKTIGNARREWLERFEKNLEGGN